MNYEQPKHHFAYCPVWQEYDRELEQAYQEGLSEMTLKPTKNRVLLRPDPEAKVIGGLTVMETMPAYSTTGEVLEVGGGEDPPVSVGDRVVYLRTVGRQVVWQGETLLSLHFSELLGVFEDGAKPEPILA